MDEEEEKSDGSESESESESESGSEDGSEESGSEDESVRVGGQGFSGCLRRRRKRGNMLASGGVNDAFVLSLGGATNSSFLIRGCESNRRP